MVYKSYSGSSVDYEAQRRRNNSNANFFQEPRVNGNLVALVGTPSKNVPSTKRKDEKIKLIDRLDNDLLGYNLNGKICLMRTKKNNKDFDMYLSLPFTKGVTERITGRTLLILGSSAHHGEAMLGQFSGVIWQPNLLEEVKKYGNTIRWINVGNLKTGFVGLDFNPNAQIDEGIARGLEDVKFLAKNLLEFGYEDNKRLFLLKPPYIVESEYGKEMRKKGYNRLRDYLA